MLSQTWKDPEFKIFKNLRYRGVNSGTHVVVSIFFNISIVFEIKIEYAQDIKVQLYYRIW